MRSARLVWLLALCAGVCSQAGAATENLILEMTTQGGRIQVAPQGDYNRRFFVASPAQWSSAGRLVLADEMSWSGDTLYLGGQTYTEERLGRMEIETSGRSVKVLLYDRGPEARASRRPSNRTGLATEVFVKAGEFIRGYVLNFGGNVNVAGEVNRSVVSVGGDIYVEDGGVVRGSVVSLGGDVHKTQEATVYGDLYASNRQKFKPRWYEDPDQNILQFDMAFDYNRVTGALPWARFAIGPEEGPAPRLIADGGYAFQSELWHYRLGVGRNDHRGVKYVLGAYRETLNDDQLRIGGNENTIMALFFSTDYRDYYFGEGFRAGAGWGWGQDRLVRLDYMNETLSPLEANTSQWSLFGSSFPPNYDQLQRTGDTSYVRDFSGRLVFLRGELKWYWPEYAASDEGLWGAALVGEWSDSSLASDFAYRRLYLDAGRRQPLWRDQQVRLRILTGSSGGRLPATRLFYLGGIGSLRGYPYKAYYGDRMWLANVEYGWSFSAFEIFALFDAGQVGSTSAFLEGPMLWNVGAGLQLRHTLRVQVAFPGADTDLKPLVTVRFSKPFR